MTDQIVLTVHAIGRDDAATRATALARTRGYRVERVARCTLVLGQSYHDDRREPLAWEVALAVRPS